MPTTLTPIQALRVLIEDLEHGGKCFGTDSRRIEFMQEVIDRHSSDDQEVMIAGLKRINAQLASECDRLRKQSSSPRSHGQVARDLSEDNTLSFLDLSLQSVLDNIPRSHPAWGVFSRARGALDDLYRSAGE